MAVDTVVRTTRRAREIQESLALAGEEWDTWFDRHADNADLRCFGRHFDLLRLVMVRTAEEIGKGLQAITGSTGQVYARCRELEDAVILAHRFFRWYAEKYEQRLNPALSSTLRAADALVRSCWAGSPTELEGRILPAPLVIDDHTMRASATARTHLPTQLRPRRDTVLHGVIAKLPIGLICLPSLVAHRSWWLVLVAHEVGHLRQRDQSATVKPVGDLIDSFGDTSAPLWTPWLSEICADGFSIAAVGSAAAWAIDELSQDEPRRLVVAQAVGADSYPPVPIRLALMGETAHAFGWESALPDAGGMKSWLDSEAAGSPALPWLKENLDLVPQVAAVLASSYAEIALPAPPAQLSGWAQKLSEVDPLFSGVRSRSAARTMIAAGVQSYQHHVENDLETHLARRLHHQLTRHLGSCGEPGMLGVQTTLSFEGLASSIAHDIVELSIEAA